MVFGGVDPLAAAFSSKSGPLLWTLTPLKMPFENCDELNSTFWTSWGLLKSQASPRTVVAKSGPLVRWGR